MRPGQRLQIPQGYKKYNLTILKISDDHCHRLVSELRFFKGNSIQKYRVAVYFIFFLYFMVFIVISFSFENDSTVLLIGFTSLLWCTMKSKQQVVNKKQDQPCQKQGDCVLLCKGESVGGAIAAKQLSPERVTHKLGKDCGLSFCTLVPNKLPNLTNYKIYCGFSSPPGNPNQTLHCRITGPAGTCRCQ